MGKIKNKRVIVAMSGGVDSSVAAALLKREGFDVIGVFMKFWSTENRCCSPESERRARKVAAKLNIPFYVFNFEKEFKKKVVDYFLKAHKIGLTPNPCVVCNKEIKFGFLFKKLKTDYIATGHYARIQKGRLLRAKDKNKDQTYFLWKLNQKILKHVLFPVGDYTKTEVKKLAEKFNLPVLNIPESQEICFTINFKKKIGRIINTKGEAIGTHQGLCFYTIGQRKGIKIPGGPYYVLDKDVKKNILVVTNNENDLYKKELNVKNINWISGKQPKFPLKVMVKIRYRQEPALAVVDRNKVIFLKPQRAITPGQSAVFYLPAGRQVKSQELLGGGIII